jgi:hypothetical protein
MLIIRREQFEPFRAAARERHVHALLRHLRAMFPGRSAGLDDEELKEVIAEGRRRSATFGIVHEVSVIRFIEVMFLMGPDFDTDPLRPWAGAILNSPAITDPDEKVDLLYFRALRVPPTPDEEEDRDD